MQVLWFIPTHGDGRYLATSIGGRAVSFPYLRQIAQAVDNLGYAGALLPTGRSCEDAWILASSLVTHTSRMRFLVAIRPGLMSPGVAARMAATFDRISNGRLLINVVTGGDPVESAGDGLHLSHDDRYKLTDEFLTVWRQIVAGEETNFQGDYLDIQGGKILFPPVQKPYPPLWFGGSRMLEYRNLGIDTFIFSGYPHLEEAYRVAELLFPRLPLENLPNAEQQLILSPFGEIVANEKFPNQQLKEKLTATVD